MQEVVVASLLEGRSLALRAPTGSGKTLAYVLPLLTRALASRRALEAAGARASELPVPVVVVAPSQELAVQVARVGRSLLPPEASSLLVQQAIGSASLWRQRQALKTTKPLLLAGTPGRLADLSREGALPTHKTSSLVLDEADALLSPRFAEDLKRLTAHVGARVEGGRQTVLVSASLGQAALLKARRMKAEKESPGPARIKLASPFESDGAFVCVAASYRGRAERVQVGAAFDAKGGIKGGEALEGELPKQSSQDSTRRSSAPSPSTPVLRASLPPTLSHLAFEVPARHAADGVRRALNALGSRRALVFLNRPRQLKDVQAKLASRGMAAGALHGDLSSAERRQVVRAFQNGKLRALLVSDVAARGLDVSGCDAVVNADLPANATAYAHRGGRTGRFGAPGTVVTLVPAGAERHLERLGRGLGLRIPLKELKGGEFSERESSESKRDGQAWTREADDRDGRPGKQERPMVKPSSKSGGTAPREGRRDGRPAPLAAAQVSERGRRVGSRGRMEEEDPWGGPALSGAEEPPLSRRLAADRAFGRPRRHERPQVRNSRRPQFRETRRESGREGRRER
ncbi:hypothetical protein H632_c765p0 [Helicosporidium sp. ATCC 50920]|nr:hypothetical protein H632_c765p0 [Helicosporidium sp. ATCC 50920]|eukprot:KDD75285.1 hypothetical protein H632_c765p0 [Helicosporidium sp. ATCC 50920]